jgi:hypothetical protein
MTTARGHLRGLPLTHGSDRSVVIHGALLSRRSEAGTASGGSPGAPERRQAVVWRLRSDRACRSSTNKTMSPRVRTLRRGHSQFCCEIGFIHNARSRIQRVHLLGFQATQHVTPDNGLREALCYSDLLDARFFDKYRFVPGTADDSSTTRSISFSRPMTVSSFPSRASWVRLWPKGSCIIDGVPSASAPALPLVAPGQHLDYPPAEPVEIGAERDQDLDGDPLALAEQDVLGADEAVAQLQGFAQGVFEHLLGAGFCRDGVCWPLSIMFSTG